MLLASCSSDTKMTTASGVELQYFNKGEGGSPQQGEIMSVNMQYADENGNVLFETAKAGGPVPIIFDTAKVERWWNAV